MVPRDTSVKSLTKGILSSGAEVWASDIFYRGG